MKILPKPIAFSLPVRRISTLYMHCVARNGVSDGRWWSERSIDEPRWSNVGMPTRRRPADGPSAGARPRR